MPQKKVPNQDIAYSIATHSDYVDNLMYCENYKAFFLYNEGYYAEMKKQEMLELIYKYTKSNHPSQALTNTMVKDIYELVTYECQNVVDDIDSHYIALDDYLLDLDDFGLVHFTPENVAIHKVDVHSSTLVEETPIFKKFLESTFVNDSGGTDFQLIQVVQEMMGFYLLNELQPHVVFFLVGQGSNGKSVLVNVIQDMIGKKFTTAMSIQTLTTNQYATSDLVGKKINVCLEEESKYIKSDKFKALVSGDWIQAERKFESSFVFKPKCKYLFATNEMPTFEGLNVGIKRRVKIIPFNKIFSEAEQDNKLEGKLKEEMGGILKWAIEGAKRLRDQKYSFTDSDMVTLAKREFETSISSGLKFFGERYIVSSGGRIARDEMYQEYRRWCEQNGRKSMNSTNFYKDLKNHVENLEEKLLRIDKKPMRCFNVERAVMPEGMAQEKLEIELVDEYEDEELPEYNLEDVNFNENGEPEQSTF